MKKRGFTLIELMVVVVIIGILAAIAIPNFIKIVDRAKEASVKANQHTVQVSIESMSIDLLGVYPTRQANIILDLPPNLRNPFDASEPIATFFVVQAGDPNYVPGTVVADCEGRVEYAHDGAGIDNATGYTVSGGGKNDVVLDLQLIPGK